MWDVIRFVVAIAGVGVNLWLYVAWLELGVLSLVNAVLAAALSCLAWQCGREIWSRMEW